MHRIVVLVLLLAFAVSQLPGAASAQSSTDGEAAAAAAVEISVLEAVGDYNALYDRIHPDAHAIVPRAAVIGWYQNAFGPRGPEAITVTGVQFVEWTWGVTGETYPYTAAVSFRQPFADGSVDEGVVHLVQDADGAWRWFFGRSQEFVDQQIALYVPQTADTGGDALLDFVVADLNEFWATSFSAADRAYVAPDLVEIHSITYTACEGELDPELIPAAYCPADGTIYFAPDLFALYEDVIGDFAWITILAHEWGHHAQALEGLYTAPGVQHELQADCLAGSYARDAETRGLLDSGDVTEAVSVAAASGDPAWLPEDGRDAHGTGDNRVSAFMSGYRDGFIGCDFMATGGVSSAMTQPVLAIA